VHIIHIYIYKTDIQETRRPEVATPSATGRRDHGSSFATHALARDKRNRCQTACRGRSIEGGNNRPAIRNGMVTISFIIYISGVICCNMDIPSDGGIYARNILLPSPTPHAYYKGLYVQLYAYTYFTPGFRRPVASANLSQETHR
jgi:hypothetical protein